MMMIIAIEQANLNVLNMLLLKSLKKSIYELQLAVETATNLDAIHTAHKHLNSALHLLKAVEASGCSSQMLPSHKKVCF